MECLHTIHAHKSPVWSVAITVRATGEVIALSTAADGSIKSWTAMTGKKIVTFKGHSDRVLSTYLYDPTGPNPLLFSGKKFQ
jgi:WD40 repeat protein